MSQPVLRPDLLRTSGALLAANTVLGRCFDRASIDSTGEDPTTVDLLVRLDQAPEQRLRAVDLAGQLMLSPSHVSRRIDRAEHAGFVERLPDPADRRAALVALTPAGRAVLEAFASPARVVIEDVITSQLSGDEIDTLVELLERIESAASTHLRARSDH